MSEPTDKNKVSIHPAGYIELTLVGDQTEETFRQVYEAAEPLIEKLKSEGRPMLGLIDMAQQTGYTLASDKAALELLEKIDYDKLAMCNPPYAAVAQGIIL